MSVPFAYLVSYVIIAVAILTALATVAMVAYLLYYYVARGWLSKVVRAPATVLRKRQRAWEIDAPKGLLVHAAPVTAPVRLALSFFLNRLPWYDPEAPIYDSCDYFITFDARGREIEFGVPEDVYIDTDEGDRGLLVYKGNLFRHFIRGAA